MEGLCTLHAIGYQAAFLLRNAPLTGEFVDIEIGLRVDALGDRALFRSTTLISKKDLLRLVAHLEHHMDELREHPDHESSLFVPLELGFQLQASAGEFVTPKDGAFTLRLMVNVGDNNSETRVYVGCEGSVTFDAVRTFITNIKQALQRAECSQ